MDPFDGAMGMYGDGLRDAPCRKRLSRFDPALQPRLGQPPNALLVYDLGFASPVRTTPADFKPALLNNFPAVLRAS